MTLEKAFMILARLNERLDSGTSGIYGFPDPDYYTDEEWTVDVRESITTVVRDYLERMEAEKRIER